MAHGRSQTRGWIGATPQPQQHGIQAAFANYTTVHGNAGSLTHWVRPRIEPKSSEILVGLVIAEPQRALLHSSCKPIPATLIYCIILGQDTCRYKSSIKLWARTSFERNGDAVLFSPSLLYFSLTVLCPNCQCYPNLVPPRSLSNMAWQRSFRREGFRLKPSDKQIPARTCVTNSYLICCD